MKLLEMRKLHTEVQNAQVVPRKDGTLQGESFFVDLVIQRMEKWH